MAINLVGARAASLEFAFMTCFRLPTASPGLMLIRFAVCERKLRLHALLLSRERVEGNLTSTILRRLLGFGCS